MGNFWKRVAGFASLAAIFFRAIQNLGEQNA